MVFLPAVLCNAELYHPQIEALRDLVDPMVLTVAEATLAESATAVLQQAPLHFLLMGTSYGGSLALEVVARAPSRVVGLWLMGCNPGPHNDPAAARLRNDRVRRGEFDAVVEELATRIAYERGPKAVEAKSSLRRLSRIAGMAGLARQKTAQLRR